MSSSTFWTFLYAANLQGLVWARLTVATAAYLYVLSLFAKSSWWIQRRFWCNQSAGWKQSHSFARQASQDCDERWLYPQCLRVGVFAYASKIHSEDACMQSLIDVCDNFPVGKHLHAHCVICGLFGLAEVQSWLAGSTKDYVRQICLTGHSKIRGAWLKTTSPPFHPLLASMVSALHHSFTHSFFFCTGSFHSGAFFTWLHNEDE